MKIPGDSKLLSGIPFIGQLINVTVIPYVFFSLKYTRSSERPSLDLLILGLFNVPFFKFMCYTASNHRTAVWNIDFIEMSFTALHRAACVNHRLERMLKEEVVGLRAQVQNLALQIKKQLCYPLPITADTRSESWTVFAPSNAEIVGSNSTEDMSVWVYSVCR
jgi:hypothetical protein